MLIRNADRCWACLSGPHLFHFTGLTWNWSYPRASLYFPKPRTALFPQGRIPLSTSPALMWHWCPPLESHLLADVFSKVGVLVLNHWCRTYQLYPDSGGQIGQDKSWIVPTYACKPSVKPRHQALPDSLQTCQFNLEVLWVICVCQAILQWDIIVGPIDVGHDSVPWLFICAKGFKFESVTFLTLLRTPNIVCIPEDVSHATSNCYVKIMADLLCS